MVSNRDFQKKNRSVAVKIINCFRDLSVWINQKNLLSFGILSNASDCPFLAQTKEDNPKSYDTLAYLFIMFCEDRAFFFRSLHVRL